MAPCTAFIVVRIKVDRRRYGKLNANAIFVRPGKCPFDEAMKISIYLLTHTTIMMIDLNK